MTHQPSPWRLASLILLLALIAWCIAWESWIAPLRPGGSWLILKAVPLALPLFGLLHDRRRSFQWLSLLVWLYALEGGTRLFSDPPGLRWPAAVELILVFLLFVAISLHLRRRS